MKKIHLISCLCAVVALVSQAAQAEVKVRAGVAGSTYRLGADYITATSSFNQATVGLTFAAENGFYVDLAASGGTGKHDGWAVANAPTTICTGSSSCGNTASPNENFKRSYMALIFGASKLNPDNGIGGAFYIGLKIGSTTLGAKNAGLRWSEEIFDTAGLVVGGGSSLPIASGRAGSIGVNYGLGVMGATWKDDTGFNKKSDTAFGYSFGVNYTYPFTSNLGVAVDYKGNFYSYDFGTTNNPFTVRETVRVLGATVYAKF